MFNKSIDTAAAQTAVGGNGLSEVQFVSRIRLQNDGNEATSLAGGTGLAMTFPTELASNGTAVIWDNDRRGFIIQEEGDYLVVCTSHLSIGQTHSSNMRMMVNETTDSRQMYSENNGGQNDSSHFYVTALSMSIGDKIQLSCTARNNLGPIAGLITRGTCMSVIKLA